MSVFKQKSQESSGPGGSDTDLSVGTRTNTDMVVASSSGDDVTLPAATNNKAGLKTGTDKQQLDASPAKWAVGTYSSGDQVVHDRKVYECIVDRTNAESDDPATDTTGWRVLSGGTGSGSGISSVATDDTLTGSGASSADPLKVANPFTDADESHIDAVPALWAAGTHTAGDQVVHAQKVYECIVDRTGSDTDNPATDTTGWRVLNGGSGSGSSGIEVKDEGTALSTAATALDFVGTGVEVTGNGAEKRVSIAGTPALAAVATSGAYNDLDGRPVIPAGSVVVGSIPQAITGTASGSAMAANAEEDITVSSVGAPASYFTAGTSGDAGKIVIKRAGTYVLYGDIAVDNVGGDRTGPSFVVEGTGVEEIFYSNAYLRNASTAITVRRSVVFTVTAANTAIALKVINRDIANGSTSFDTVALSFTAVSNLRIIPVGGTEGAQGIPGVAGSGSVPVWAAGIFSIGDQVSYDDKIYVCLTARTAGDTSNPSADTTGWAPLGRALTDVELGKLADGPAKWAAAVHSIGDMAVWAGKVYECILARTGSDTDNPATDTTGWRVLSGGTGSGGTGSGVQVKDEGTALTTAATGFDFRGRLVTASGAGAEKRVTVEGLDALSYAFDRLWVWVTPAQLDRLHNAWLSFDGTDFWGAINVSEQNATRTAHTAEIILPQPLPIPATDFALYDAHGKILDLLQANKQSGAQGNVRSAGQWTVYEKDNLNETLHKHSQQIHERALAADGLTTGQKNHLAAIPPLWSAGIHAQGAQVVWNDKIYECIVARVAGDTDNPATDTTGWRVLSGGTGGGGSFTPSKSNIYAAVKDVLHPTTNAGVSADDTNNELDIAGDDVTASRIANALESIGLATLGVLTRNNTIAGAGNENRINMTSSAIAMRFSATTYAVAAEAIDVGTILRFTATGNKLVIARVTSIVAELESSQIVSVGVTYLTGSHTTFSTASGGDSVTTEAYALDASEIAKRVIQNPYTGTDDEKAAFRTAIGAGTGGGSGPILYDKLVVYVNTNQLRQITGAGGPISFDGTEFWDPVGFGWIGDYSVNQHIRIYIEDGLAIPTGDFGLYTQTDGKVLDLTQANKQADESSVNANLGEWAVDKNIVPLDSVLAGLSLRQQSIVSQIAFNTLQTVVTPAQLAAMRSQSLSFDGGTTTWVPDDIFFEPQGTSANWHIWIVLPKNVYIPDSGDVTITYTGGPLTLTRANQQRVRTNVDALGEWSTYGFTSQEFFQRRALQRDYTVALRFWRDNSATPAAIPSDAGTLNVDPEAGLYAVNFPAGATNRRAHFALPQQYEIGYVAIDNRNRLSDFNNRIVSGQRVYDVASALSNTLEAFQMLIEVTVAE